MLNRRDFLRKCCLAIGGASLLDSKLFAGGVNFANRTLGFQIGARRYNVLFVLVDQWRFCSFSHGAHHDKLVRTPNLDKFAKEGVQWSRCYAAQPVCTPNRSAIMTGRFPHETGMYQNDLLLPQEERCIAHEFTKAGYNCHYIGKWHMDGAAKPGFVAPGWRRRGFTTFEGFNRGHVYFDSKTFDNEGTLMSGLNGIYEPTFQTDLAIDFMKQNKKHPFFCFVSWGPPHTPYGQHPPEFSYNSGDVVFRPNVSGGNAGDIANYFGHCTALDHEFGRLMKALENFGLKANTLVVFASDHGDMLKSQGLTTKNYPEEESSHIPLLMRLPGRIEGGKAVQNLISSVDLMPTILSICGLDTPGTCTGKDKAAAMTDKGMPDESIYSIGHFKNYFWRMVVKGKYKLIIKIVSLVDTATDLYDLEADPYEQTNRINNGGVYAAAKADLWTEYQSWKARTNDPFPNDPPLA